MVHVLRIYNDTVFLSYSPQSSLRIFCYLYIYIEGIVWIHSVYTHTEESHIISVALHGGAVYGDWFFCNCGKKGKLGHLKIKGKLHENELFYIQRTYVIWVLCRRILSVCVCVNTVYISKWSPIYIFSSSPLSVV